MRRTPRRTNRRAGTGTGCGGCTARAEPPVAAGGSGALACSADMLREAVVACAGVTISGGRVVAEGVWDVRGTLGVDRSVPVGLTEVTLSFEIDSDADAAKLDRMIQTTERYCVILQTLRTPPVITLRR